MSEENTTASFGYWIRRQRMALDMTQAALARQVGCATITISKIERDERRPSRQMAELLADQLGITDEEREQFLAVALGEESVVWMSITSEPVDAHENLTPLSSSSSTSSLPTPSTPFVGRNIELEQIVQQINDPDCRLLSLVGPGGFGKTRLAIRAGESLSQQEEFFSNGVFFVPLDGLEQPEQVVPAIASALRFTFVEQQEQQESLLNYLGNKQLLLILDNAEQILDPDLVNLILAKAPNIKILITSRETLNLVQEWLIPVGGMQVADESSDGADDDAIQLFNATASRLQPNFAPETERQHVTRICQLVGGVPLAIELSAAWCKALPCGQIVDELERNLSLLSTTMRNVPERHHSMNGILEQSWSFLTEEEQSVFCRLSVFVGGFRSDAARAVAGASFMVLATLVEKSVLQLGQDGRYRIHALLRQLGSKKLAGSAEEKEKTQAKHSLYYLDFLVQRNEPIRERGQRDVLEEVDKEFDNIRLAWSYTVQNGELEKLEKALPCLFRYLWTRGKFEEGEQMMQVQDSANVKPLPEGENELIPIRLSAYKAQFMAASDKYVEATAVIDKAQLGAEKTGNQHGRALCFSAKGLINQFQDNFSQSLSYLQQSYALYQILNEPAEEAQVAGRLGYIFSLVDDNARGQAITHKALDYFRSAGDITNVAETLNYLGAMQWRIGNFNEGEQHFEESLALAQEVDHQLVIAMATGGLGLIAASREQWDTAIRFFEKRRALMCEIGNLEEADSSNAMIFGVYVRSERYTEAIAIVEGTPNLKDMPDIAKAYVGLDMYEVAIDHLLRDSVREEASRALSFYSEYIVGWAMLLMSKCRFVRIIDGSDAPQIIDADKQIRIAVQLLLFLRDFDGCRAITHQEVRHMLNQTTDRLPPAEYDSIQEQIANRSIDDLAQDMLCLRLSSGS